jgi:hypothetical protein
MRHVETSARGELLNQDTFYSGQLKGVGKIYDQVVIDAFCSLAFAKVYTSKMPIIAADLIYDRVLPFYDTLGVTIQAILTDNGREFCGKPEGHPYELLLALHVTGPPGSGRREPMALQSGRIGRCSTSTSGPRAKRTGTNQPTRSRLISTSS